MLFVIYRNGSLGNTNPYLLYKFLLFFAYKTDSVFVFLTGSDWVLAMVRVSRTGG
jgi:hypothetical protein